MSRAAISLLLAAAALGCADPVHDDVVTALGPERGGVPAGPLHRPGQPCLVCHDGGGPGDMVLRFGGTIYQNDVDDTPLVAATVTLTDAKAHTRVAVTNCAGNFFVQAVDWSPVFPVHVQVDYGSVSATMQNHIGREGSCAACHTGKDSSTSVVHPYLTSDPMTYQPSGCP
jgi:hypothetical protein